MNISNETSNKILQILNHPNSKGLKEKMENIDPKVVLEMLKQMNPSENDFKRAEEKIKGMSKEELLGEVMKKLKG